MVNYGPASKYYDLFGSKSDIPFYRRLAIQQGPKALELGVGTGRVAIALAKADVTVWGLDNSQYMLNVARKKLRAESPAVRKRVRLLLADMREFELDETFPFVYMASSTFEHCVTEQDQWKCLASVSRACRNGGILAFDISQAGRRSPSSWWIDRRDLESGDEVVRTGFSRINPQTDVVSVDLFFDVYRRGSLRERFHEYGEAKLSAREDIEKLLEECGFMVQKVYGDFTESPPSEQHQQIAFVCSKQRAPVTRRTES